MKIWYLAFAKNVHRLKKNNTLKTNSVEVRFVQKA